MAKKPEPSDGGRLSRLSSLRNEIARRYGALRHLLDPHHGAEVGHAPPVRVSGDGGLTRADQDPEPGMGELSVRKEGRELHSTSDTSSAFSFQVENTVPVLDPTAELTYRFGMNPVRSFREKAKLTQAQLAERVGTSQPQIKRLETGERKLTKEWAERLAPALGVPAELLLFPPKTVAVRGRVGAGAAVQFYGEDEGELDEVPRPEGATETTSALEVTGDSMPGVAEDGWHVYYDERVQGVPDHFIGKVCLVWLADERVLVKKVFRGRDPGAFDLVSTSGQAPMRDEEVAWSAKVTWIKPN